MSDYSDVKNDYEDLKDRFKKTNYEDFKKGIWLQEFVKWVLKNYENRVDAAYIAKHYPGSGPKNQANKAISIASKYASISGGLSASAVTALELSAIGTFGSDLPIAVPAVGCIIMTDVAYTTRLQIRTAYDLSVIHKAPLSSDDVEDCYFFLLHALGINIADIAKDFFKAVGPKILAFNIRKLLRMGLRNVIVNVIGKIAGTAIAKKVTEKALIRILVPGIGIPISAGLNYYFTTGALKVANSQMQKRSSVVLPILKLFKCAPDFPREFLIKLLIVLMEFPNRAGWDELQLNVLRYAQTTLSLNDDEISTLENYFDMKPEELMKEMPNVNKNGVKHILEFLTVAAACDNTPENDEAYFHVLKQISEYFGLEYFVGAIALERARQQSF